MLRARVELTVYADDEGAIDPDRVDRLVGQAKTLGYDTAPIEYVPPTEEITPTGKVRVPWGLRIVGIDEDDQEINQ